MMPLVTLAGEGEIEMPKEFKAFNTQTIALHLPVAGKIMSKKATRLLTGEMAHQLQMNLAGDVKVEDAQAIALNGNMKSLRLKFNKASGEKYLASLIKKYGMPVGDMIDNYEWTIDEVTFEIHETASGYEASYTAVK